MFEALVNSIVLGLSSSLAAAVIGTLGAVGFTKIQARTKNVVEYISMPVSYTHLRTAGQYGR